MKIKALLVLILTVAVCLAAAGCSSSSKGGEPLELIDGRVNYSVVYPKGASTLISESAERIAAALEAASGGEVTVNDDTVNADCEILVGRTFRAESAECFAELDMNEYCIEHSGSRVVVIGSDDIMTVAAAEKLASSLDGFEFSSDSFGQSKYKPEDGAIGGKYYLAKTEGMFKAQGRTIMYEQGLAMLSSADILEFNADCEGKVTVSILAEEDLDSGAVDVYYTAFVDGVRNETRYEIKEKGSHELVIAEGLEKGEHSFKLVRQTEWNHGNIYVTALELDGSLTAPPAANELYIEFIGDSLTTGFGNLTNVQAEDDWGGSPVYHDATQAYPYMTAQALGADLSVVAIQGIGSACGGHPFTMNEIYGFYPRVNERDYTYEEERSADIVVINMLANDAGYRREAKLTPQDIVAKAKELCEMARAAHPDALIVFSPASFKDKVEEMIENELGGEKEGYYMTQIPLDGKGKSGHPSIEGHQSGTDHLVEYLGDLIEKNSD